MVTNRCSYFLAFLALLIIACIARADNDTNLARAKGTAPFGSGGYGPFTIAKINDGRLNGSLAMWGTSGQPGAFAGVQLGETPVTFNTVRFYLFNGRADFTGWRIEGSNDCQIDEDSLVANFYDPQLIAADNETHFTNANTKENNVITVSFKAVSYKYVRLIFPNKSGLLAVPELEVFNRNDNLTDRAGVSGDNNIVVDSNKLTITIAAPLSTNELVGKLSKQPANTVTACDSSGGKLKDSDLLKSGAMIVARHQAGGNDLPFRTQYKFYTVVDSSAPPAAPKPYVPSTRPPLPAKPLMSPASAPPAPSDAINLVEGKTITASINARTAVDLARPADANWFANQRYPQWFKVDLGAELEFDYVSMRVLAPLSLQHFWIQTSHDGSAWKNLVEVKDVRKNVLWAGYFEKTKARYVRAILTPPSSDVHVKKFIVANLARPLTDKDGKVAPTLKPVFGEEPDWTKLPAAASMDEAKPSRKGKKE